MATAERGAREAARGLGAVCVLLVFSACALTESLSDTEGAERSGRPGEPGSGGADAEEIDAGSGGAASAGEGGMASAGSGGAGATGGGGGARFDAGQSSGGADGGEDAAPPSCPPAQCGGRGLCEVTASGPVCACDEGFDGPDCSTRTVDYGRRLKIAEHLADPDVVALAEDWYLLSGTGSSVDFAFLESSDLVHWSPVGTYDPSAADPHHDYCFCWAPDIVRAGTELHFYFSAHRGPKGATACPPPNGWDVATYRAVSPDGSLAFGAPEPLFPGGAGAHTRPQAGCPPGGCGMAIRIDPTVYDGRLYYVFFDRGNNVASVSMADGGDFRMHAGPAGFALPAFEEGINEAPELLQREGRSYLFFSAAWFDSQYATFYVMGDSPASLNRHSPVQRLSTPVRRGDGTLIETHGHNSIVTRRGETFNFFHVGVFDPAGGLVRRDTYRQRIAWRADGVAMSQNEVHVSWNPLAGSEGYSLDLVLRDGSTIGPCIAIWRIGHATSTTYTGVCPDAGDRLVHKSEVQAFRLYSSFGGAFVPVGETPFDGYSDGVGIVAAPP